MTRADANEQITRLFIYSASLFFAPPPSRARPFFRFFLRHEYARTFFNYRHVRFVKLVGRVGPIIIRYVRFSGQNQ